MYNKINDWDLWLGENGVANYDVVVIEGDFSPNSISLFFSLIKLNCVIVPLTDSVSEKRNVFIEIAKAKYVISIEANDHVSIIKTDHSKKMFPFIKP